MRELLKNEWIKAGLYILATASASLGGGHFGYYAPEMQKIEASSGYSSQEVQILQNYIQLLEKAKCNANSTH